MPLSTALKRQRNELHAMQRQRRRAIAENEDHKLRRLVRSLHAAGQPISQDLQAYLPKLRPGQQYRRDWRGAANGKPLTVRGRLPTVWVTGRLHTPSVPSKGTDRTNSVPVTIDHALTSAANQVGILLQGLTGYVPHTSDEEPLQNDALMVEEEGLEEDPLLEAAEGGHNIDGQDPPPAGGADGLAAA